MDQPSQQYPPWLTPVPSVVTDAAGSPVATVTVVSYIAPTYYGPSIPLGTLYSYGGYTFPPTVVWPGSPATTGLTGATTITTVTPITTTGPPTTATVSPTTISSTTISSTTIPFTTIPSTTIVTTSSTSIMSSTTPGVTISTPIPTTATPTLSSTSGTPITPTISVPSSTSLTVSSSTSTGAPAPSVSPSGISHATGLTKGQLVGIVVASVLGLIFLFVLALFLYLWFKALKNRRQYATLSPIDDDYVVIPPGGRFPGEGSPRHSGEEHDSFLRPRAETSAAAAASSRPRGPQATANSNSSESSNSHASGFGVLLDKPSIGFTPSIPEEFRTGRALSPNDLQRLGREDVLPEEMEYDDGEYTGAYAYSTSPPALSRLDPAAAPLLGGAALPLRRSKSSLRGEPEEATVHTARRVKVEDLGPRELADATSSRKSSHGILSAIGLGGLANLARKSWFKHFDSPRQSAVSASEFEPLSEKDIEAGHETPTAERPVDSFGVRSRGTPSQDGTRPISRVSARSGASGATQYHDAQSSLQGGASSLTPPPRALTPVDPPPTIEQTWVSSPLAGPPIYEDQPPASSSPPRNDSQTSFEFPAGVDILDMPAPTALTHFASISDIQSGSSCGTKPSLFPPPGLETIRAIGWIDSPTESARASYGFTSGRHIPSPGDLDVLEEAPPEAENGWRSIAPDSNRRGTFGTYVQGHDFASERASLYSMRSHLSPSTRSAGSAPFGRFEMGSVNSNGSRPSAHSRSASSGMHSLVHQGSIPSDLRRKNGSGGHSPARSAFGIRRASPGFDQSVDSPIVGTPPLVHVSPQKSIASGSTTLFDASSRTLRGLPTPPRSHSASPLSTNFQLNPPPWVGGLAHDWQPAP